MNKAEVFQGILAKVDIEGIKAYGTRNLRYEHQSGESTSSDRNEYLVGSRQA